MGEWHTHLHPIKFMINNLQLLKSLGVETMGLEILFCDTHQHLLDEFHTSPPDAPMPPVLEAFLAARSFEGCSYITLLQEAKKLGLRIVALDSSLAFEIMNFKNGYEALERCVTMNYVAKKILDDVLRRSSGKVLVHMGGAHAASIILEKESQRPGLSVIHGVADYIRSPYICIADSINGKHSVNINVRDHKSTGGRRKIMHLYLQRPVET